DQPPLRLLGTASRFSSTVRLAKTWRPWGTRPIPRRAMTYEGRPLISSPSRVMDPAVRIGGVIPQIVRTRVDLPIPLRPSSATNSPTLISSDTPCSTVAVAYPECTSRSRSIPVCPSQVDRLHVRVPAHLVRGSELDRPAVVQTQHAVGEFQCQRHVVLDQQQ